ncbi:hypothetical protein ABH931_006450 [Streptacidiphilus sp. MAP12-33]|uniref:hypothetical protein n=1 Tax=Streptacidiphilus sp. MAP12-33 TaxID=3156266 RepID=UPI003518A17E
MGGGLGCAGGVVCVEPPGDDVAAGVVRTGTGTTAVAPALGRAALAPGLAEVPPLGASPGWCRTPTW